MGWPEATAPPSPLNAVGDGVWQERFPSHEEGKGQRQSDRHPESNSARELAAFAAGTSRQTDTSHLLPDVTEALRTTKGGRGRKAPVLRRFSLGTSFPEWLRGGVRSKRHRKDALINSLKYLSFQYQHLRRQRPKGQGGWDGAEEPY